MRQPKIIVHIRSAVLARSWFDDLDPQQQRAYIKAHPNSKYAKNAKRLADKDDKKGKTKKAATTAPVVHKPVKEVFAEKIKTLDPEDKEFFETEQDKPGSKTRVSIGKHLRTKRHEIAEHIKGQVKEWGTGCNAIAKLAGGKSISDHEKKALKALVIDACVTSAVVAATGGFAHGVALALKHTAFDVVKDVVLKAVIRGTAKAMGTSMGVTGLSATLETLASSADDKRNEKILAQLVAQVAKFIEKGHIPEEAWEAAIDQLQKKAKKKR
jgi:hypothetical protein